MGKRKPFQKGYVLQWESRLFFKHLKAEEIEREEWARNQETIATEE